MDSISVIPAQLCAQAKGIKSAKLIMFPRKHVLALLNTSGRLESNEDEAYVPDIEIYAAR